jgi:uncharacterized protein YndB with AHSA1/START domain
MWWLWIVVPLSSIVLLLVLVSLAGAALPREHKASCAAVFRVAPERLWTILTNFPGRPQWLSIVKSVERLPDQDGRQVWRETWGFGDKVDVEVVELAPPRRLVTRIVDNGRRPFGGRWIFEITTADSGSRLAITEVGWISNPLFRFLARFAFGYTRTLETFLKDLGRHLGEEMRIERAAE